MKNTKKLMALALLCMGASFVGNAVAMNNQEKTNETDSSIDNIVIYAVKNADQGLLKQALEKGAKVNARDDKGNTALHLLATDDMWQSHKNLRNIDDRKNLLLKMVNLVLTYNIDVNSKNNEGKTALFYATDCILYHPEDSIQFDEKGNPRNAGCDPLWLVRKLLKNKTDANIQDNDGNTVMHKIANRLGSLERRQDNKEWYEIVEQRRVYLMKVLVKYGAKLNIKNKRGLLPLHQAVKAQAPRLIQAMLDETENKDINEVDKEGNTPFMHAASTGEPVIMSLLLNNGAKPKVVNSRLETEFHAMVRGVKLENDYQVHNYIKTIELFNELGIDVNHQNKAGKTAIELLLQDPFCSTQPVELFLKHSKVNANGATFMNLVNNETVNRYAHFRKMKIFFEKADLLLKLGSVNINDVDCYGRNALQFFIDHPFVFETDFVIILEVMEFLLKNGAKITSSDFFNVIEKENSYNSYANQQSGAGLYARRLDLLAMLNLFFKYNAIDIDCKSNYGTTALMYAVNRDNLELVELLIANGARLDIKNKQGLMAYDLAVQAGRTTIVKYLQPFYNFELNNNKQLVMFDGNFEVKPDDVRKMLFGWLLKKALKNRNPINPDIKTLYNLYTLGKKTNVENNQLFTDITDDVDKKKMNEVSRLYELGKHENNFDLSFNYLNNYQWL